ncbi:hypothetical protein AB1Y20_012489 [Prymnesium parvum]|uniref:Protein kinase domain-containing protein n=1 Tax=Prymnesium parvum TaxID=97485 RepID=A0AB34II12_PRYPA
MARSLASFELTPAEPEDFAHLTFDGAAEKNVFFPGDKPKKENEELQHFDLRVVFEPGTNVLEESVTFRLEAGKQIAKKYRIVEYLGVGVFSHAVQCVNLDTGGLVCVKMTRNNKDFFDQSLGEIKLLQHLNKADPDDSHCVLRMFDFFYFKEHLFIVTELLCDNLYNIYKKVSRGGCTPYFTLARVRSIAYQCLIALDFIHANNLIHCDLKPENILIQSLSRCTIKVIDFGSSCFQSDPHSSYVQSRSYRAPEVILGLPYSHKIDVFSLGCILAELLRSKVLFPNKTATHLLAGHMALCGIDSWMIEEGKHSHQYFMKNKLYIWQSAEPTSLPGEQIHQMRRRHIMHGTGGYFYIHPRPRTFEAELGVSDPVFIDLMKRLLETNMNKRITSKEALQHPWLTEPTLPRPAIYSPGKPGMILTTPFFAILCS